ncbi:parvalbumin beta-like [Leptodactylus fuscus]|uniref:parvalbumin beta-like n=1 Tax=Leptodactylus fuscus TaxID=238119 RepID=UPI003F4EA00B
MAITEILAAEDIDAALASVADDNSFEYKAFFQKVGLVGKSPDEIQKIFEILDRDRSGFIEEHELAFFLQNFKSDARCLTCAEIKDLTKDGKLGLEVSTLMALSGFVHLCCNAARACCGITDVKDYNYHNSSSVLTWHLIRDKWMSFCCKL